MTFGNVFCEFQRMIMLILYCFKRQGNPSPQALLHEIVNENGKEL